MDHLYPGVLEPMQEVIENLLTLPQKCRKAAKQTRRDSLLALTEKEEELKNLEKSLARQSAALKEKEQDLNERWDTGRIQDIPIGSILPGPGQMRRTYEAFSLYSLAESIRRNGILQPLTVRRVKSTVSDQTDSYELIAGERRLRAAAAIGKETVPCIVLEADNSRAAELALIENLQRENLNMFEHASAIASLMDIHAMTQEEIAKSLCCSQSAVANKLRILRLTEEERAIILSCQLSERHARTFLRI
ncbi:MAG: ParB/RepB/Spo0J family partition protein, partial [Eubacteriales bacterium]